MPTEPADGLAGVAGELEKRAADFVILGGYAIGDDVDTDAAAASLRDCAARLRALSPAAPAGGWTEVTSDEATWPPNTTDVILCMCPLEGEWTGVPEQRWIRYASSGDIERTGWAKRVPGYQWMPWPSAQPAAPPALLALGDPFFLVSNDGYIVTAIRNGIVKEGYTADAALRDCCASILNSLRAAGYEITKKAT